MQEQAHYSHFKKALARSDQLALEQLFVYANFLAHWESPWYPPDMGVGHEQPGVKLSTKTIGN